ncbi:MAG: hypothetical protein ACLRMJ_12370 [Alistipes finegoldii]
MAPDGGYTYRDRGNVFRNTIIRTVCRTAAGDLRQMQRFAPADARNDYAAVGAFHRFVAWCTSIRPAARSVVLCRQTLHFDRYLSTIVRSVAHSSAKEFIDRSVMLEIKMLQSTDLSVQEIAYRLGFPTSPIWAFFKASIRASLPRGVPQVTQNLNARMPKAVFLSAPSVSCLATT